MNSIQTHATHMTTRNLTQIYAALSRHDPYYLSSSVHTLYSYFFTSFCLNFLIFHLRPLTVLATTQVVLVVRCLDLASIFSINDLLLPSPLRQNKEGTIICHELRYGVVSPLSPTCSGRSCELTHEGMVYVYGSIGPR